MLNVHWSYKPCFTSINQVIFNLLFLRCLLLNKLDLSNCAIRAAGSLSLCEAMLECSQMAYLNLSNCQLGAAGIQPFARTVIATHQHLTTLDLSGNSIGYKGAQHLGEALRRNRQAFHIHKLFVYVVMFIAFC